MQVEIENVYENLTEKEKKQKLFLSQKQTLDTFLSKKAITKAQYEKSLGDLKTKMGIS